jgi:hypothetical protein
MGFIDSFFDAGAANNEKKGYEEISDEQQAQADAYMAKSKELYGTGMDQYDQATGLAQDNYTAQAAARGQTLDTQQANYGDQMAMANQLGSQGMDDASMSMAQQGSQRAASDAAANSDSAKGATSGAQAAQQTLTDSYTSLGAQDAAMRQQNQVQQMNMQGQYANNMADSSNAAADWQQGAYDAAYVNPMYNKSSMYMGAGDKALSTGQGLQGASWENQQNAASKGSEEWSSIGGGMSDIFG